ncbi:hypothetical protein DKX38_016147 [Salix brachista]|uniref:Sm domain-containing protein n=1 Tax=Salix brachista TaxID=2182728 RepID=A0A5N5L775_9ROSI|nr:hypothetical protein DKX38_016147 [Salix brachista]
MSSGGEKGSTTAKTPADFLKSIRGRPVVVKLNSGVDYRVKLNPCNKTHMEYYLNHIHMDSNMLHVTIDMYNRRCNISLLFVSPLPSNLTQGRLFGDFLVMISLYPRIFRVCLYGILACLDGYMNIAMEQTEEYVNGQLKNKYGDAFIRGNNVLYISTSKRTLADGA